MLTCLLTPFFSSTPFDICFPGRSGDLGPEKLENITPNFLQSQLPFLPRSGRGREPCYCHVASRATGRAGQWERAGLGSTAPRLRRTGTWRSAARRRRKSFFCRQEGPRCADAAPTATLPQLAVKKKKQKRKFIKSAASICLCMVSDLFLCPAQFQSCQHPLKVTSMYYLV